VERTEGWERKGSGTHGAKGYSDPLFLLFSLFLLSLLSFSSAFSSSSSSSSFFFFLFSFSFFHSSFSSSSPNDADEGPLIDYVVTLLTHDKSTEELKEYCVSNLTDFFDQRKRLPSPPIFPLCVWLRLPCQALYEVHRIDRRMLVHVACFVSRNTGICGRSLRGD